MTYVVRPSFKHPAALSTLCGVSAYWDQRVYPLFQRTVLQMDILFDAEKLAYTKSKLKSGKPILIEQPFGLNGRCS